METIQDTQHWSVDKRVNISHLMTTAAMLISLFVFINKIDQRITTLETAAKFNSDSSQRLNERLDRIEDKLDRLIEKNQ
jgi:flagellar biosynthesis/type III secretory pathway chaperone